ncbi:MAG: radical SAM protein [Clostridia bacterium]|nr:radical SAM protein [Clostridia bacterium]
MKHINIALFVTHEGCPNMCTFCNQRSISGSSKRVTPDDVREAADTALAGKKDVSGGEIAFFGGSFTMIERGYMLSMLNAAKQYIDRGLFAGIRVSTRPDGINDEICRVLKEYGVTSVELGAQSMDDRVLELNRRGHTAKDVETACALLKKYGFETGLQMMTGLYGSTDEDSIETAKKLIALKPATVRIYPTVVIEGTELCELMKSGKYTPQTVDEASELGSVLIPMFEDNGIKVIRFGLHSGGGVQGAFAGGAYHPALREMAESRIYLRKAIESADGRQGRAVVYVNPACVSKMTGQKRENIEKLSALGIDCSVKGDASLGKYEIKFELT